MQTLELDFKEVEDRMLDLTFKSEHKKVILFDLDETLAHCVRHSNLLKEPDVILNVPMPSGKFLNASFNIRPHT